MLIPDYSPLRVLVYGDVILDQYQVVEVERISPEAPVPVARVVGSPTLKLGGAAHVAASAKALGAHVALIGWRDGDDAGHAIADLCDDAGIHHQLRHGGGQTTRKTRFVTSTGQQVIRIDEEDQLDLRADADWSWGWLQGERDKNYDVIIVADYLKGAVNRSVMQALCGGGKPVYVGAKSRDLSLYAGAQVLVMNARELSDATGMPTVTDAEVEAAAREARLKLLTASMAPTPVIVTTRAGKGLTLSTSTHWHYPTLMREVIDVTGAGDTVLATLALTMMSETHETACILANLAAGIACARRGTYPVTRGELASVVYGGRLPEAAVPAAPQGKVGFVSGCFDLLHPGHLSLLTRARGECDYLIVGLNSDASAKRLKGPGRPVITAPDRAAQLRALPFVSAVLIFEEDTPIDLIRKLKPAVLFRGAEPGESTHDIVGAKEVLGWGGKVMRLDKLADHSTTRKLKALGD